MFKKHVLCNRFFDEWQQGQEINKLNPLNDTKDLIQLLYFCMLWLSELPKGKSLLGDVSFE